MWDVIAGIAAAVLWPSGWPPQQSFPHNITGRWKPDAPASKNISTNNPTPI